MKKNLWVSGLIVLVVVVILVITTIRNQNREWSLENDAVNESFYKIPNSDLIANLVSRDETATEASGPLLTLVLKKEDGSIYKRIDIPRITWMVIYSSDGEHVYIGGIHDLVQENIFRVNINNDLIEQFYFGSKGEMPGVAQFSFSENGRYMAYIDSIYGPWDTNLQSFPVIKSILYVHDFEKGTQKKITDFPIYEPSYELISKDIATWPEGGANYEWQGNTLIYNNYKGEQKIDFDLTGYSEKEQNISANSLSKDVYPLFTGFKWKNPESSEFSYGSEKFKGYKVESEQMIIQDGEDMDIWYSFLRFYEDKLIKLGYVSDNTIQADGVYSSTWGYKKGDNYIILNYHGDQIVHKEEVGGGPCPCTLDAGIFTGQKVE